ncbi:MAG: hypothetical protein GY711_19825 [bacterium]|nr:hypothetical protein [bacterium]
MPKNWIWTLAKGLEGVGLIVILVGVLASVQLGMNDEGLESQEVELYALLAGAGMFGVGFALEKALGTR